MKKLFFTLALTFAVTFFGFNNKANAQIGIPGMQGMNVQQEVEQLTQKLNLTNVQVPKITAILNKAKADIDKFKKSGLATEALKEKTDVVSANAQNKIKAVLTPDQLAKYKDMLAAKAPATPKVPTLPKGL